MTWEETILYIRTQPEYKNLVEKAYLEEDLILNVERFKASEEFIQTLNLIKEYHPNAKKILDVGCGNGVSAISFALSGFEVVAIEPDKSKTIGAGAVNWLINHYKLNNIEIHEVFAEHMAFPSESFDIVYTRQAMHHAHDLDKFLEQIGRVLKKNGVLLTIRDHIIFDEQDKNWFFQMHDLHKYYHGENAFTAEGYKNAMRKANLDVKKEFKYYDSSINYFPMTSDELKEMPNKVKQQRKNALKNKIGILCNFPFIFFLYNLYLDKKLGNALDERNVAGRMYSYIAIKQ